MLASAEPGDVQAMRLDGARQHSITDARSGDGLASSLRLEPICCSTHSEGRVSGSVQ